MLNYLDFLLIFFLVVGGLWGLLRGGGKLLISLFSLYIGLVISLLLYRPLGNFFRSVLTSMSISGSYALAFVFLLLVSVNAISFLTHFLSTPPEERRRKKKGHLQEAVTRSGRRFLTGPLNQILGLILGFAAAVVWISLFLAVLQYIFRMGLVQQGAFWTQLETSALVPWFNQALAWIYWAVSIWLPGGVPGFFEGLTQS